MTQLIVPGNADPTKVLTGSTFSAGTNYNAPGTMPNKVGSATVLTVSTADQAIPQGYYGGVTGDGKIKGEPNLIASNIPIGVTIGNVAGSAKRQASGSGTTPTVAPYTTTITGLSFTPSFIFFEIFDSVNNEYLQVTYSNPDRVSGSYTLNNYYKWIMTTSNTAPSLTGISGLWSVSNGTFTLNPNGATSFNGKSYTWRAFE